MARKKAEEKIEEKVEEKEYTYDEIHNNKLEDLAETDKEPEKTEEPKEEVKEEPKEEPKEVEEEVEFDPEQLKKEAAEEAAKKVWEEADRKQKEAEEAEKRKALEADENTAPWIKRGENTPKDYDELINWNKEVAKREIMAEFEAREAAKQAKLDEERKVQEEAKKVEEDKTKAFNQLIDEQLNDLYSSNKLPKIKDPNNKDDIGVRSRTALFQTMYDVNQERIKAGKTPIYSVKEIFYEHYKPVTEQPAGADAPISGGRIRAAAQQQKEEYDYNTIHRSSFRDLYK